MNESESCYYPPRARWYSPLLGGRDAVQRGIAHGWAYCPAGTSPAGLALAFLVPGLAFHLAGLRWWGKIVMAVCAALILLFFAGLGHSWSTFAIMAVISLHAAGLSHYCKPLFAECDWHVRLGASLALYLVVLLFYYMPLQHQLETHWLLPLRSQDKIMVVGRMNRPGTLHRGDWIACTVGHADGGEYEQRIVMEKGLEVGPVLALAGEHIVFGPVAFSVEGGPLQLRLEHMPKSGEVIVPENSWLVWPNFDIRGHGTFTEATIADVFLHAAMVPAQNFVGKPFRHWFGRSQLPP